MGIIHRVFISSEPAKLLAVFIHYFSKQLISKNIFISVSLKNKNQPNLRSY